MRIRFPGSLSGVLFLLLLSASGGRAAQSNDLWIPAEGITLTGTQRILIGPEGENEEAFYPWIKYLGVFQDPKGVFRFNDGMLHVTGEATGYLATRQMFGDYLLVAEYRWNDRPPVEGPEHLRNGGLFVHGVGEDEHWMRSLEIQLHEKRSGDLVLQRGAKATVGGQAKGRPWDTFVRLSPENPEKPLGEWNRLEAVCLGNTLRVRLNGQVVMQATGVNPSIGRIFIQSNGSEMLFRRLELHFLQAPEPPPATDTEKGS